MRMKLAVMLMLLGVCVGLSPAGKRHWAFEPLERGGPGGEGKTFNIDHFLSAGWDAQGLKPAARADKRTLIRRATFDLTGLPPTPEEVRAFEADDSPKAFEKVVQRLLASPHYGERWGRHWLDVVRYADTAGETADFPVPHAWRYRNYVIDAFNADKPYDRFIREQIAGDLMAAADPAADDKRQAELVVATGYLAISRRFGFDVAQDHFLTIEDTIDTLGKSVLGLSIACARCHDHKYDPISQNDYYALYGILESTRYPFPGCEKTKVSSDLVSLAPPAEMKRLQNRMQTGAAELRKMKQETKAAAAVTPLLTVSGEYPNGGRQELAAGVNGAKLASVEVKRGQILQLTILPKANNGGDYTAVDLNITELGGQKRSWSIGGETLADFFQGGRGYRRADGYGQAEVWHFLDLTGSAKWMPIHRKDAHGVKDFHVWRGAEEYPAVSINLNEKPIAFQTVAMPGRTFGMHPGPRGPVAVAWRSPLDGAVAIKGTVADADAKAGGDGIGWKLELLADYLGEQKTTLDLAEQVELATEEYTSRLKNAPKAYAVAEGQPHDAQLHLRGDPMTRGPAVKRRYISLFGGQEVKSASTSGRLELADWLMSGPSGDLAARVMVNRIWQEHFGAGLVRTPNDFGVRGLAPSHPLLLDRLAVRFIESGWSIKAMHRLIMMSDAYQRSSIADERAVERDPENIHLARFSRRRLSAEEIRDAALAVSGELDRTPGEAHPFPPEQSWGFTQHTPFNAVYDHNRRGVYLMTQRIKRHPFLALFDGPDANASTGQRQRTTVATQALYFMNDPFIAARAQGLAGRVEKAGDAAAKLTAVYELLMSRQPDEAEQRLAAAFMASYAQGLDGKIKDEAERKKAAWQAWLRMLLSSNEFIHVD